MLPALQSLRIRIHYNQLTNNSLFMSMEIVYTGQARDLSRGV